MRNVSAAHQRLWAGSLKSQIIGLFPTPLNKGHPLIISHSPYLGLSVAEEPLTVLANLTGLSLK